MELKRIVYIIIFMALGVSLMYLSIVLGNNKDTIIVFLPMVIGMVFFSIGVMFAIGRDRSPLIKTGFMSLATGIVLVAFAFVTFYLKGAGYILAGFLGLGILSIISSFVRFVIQGGKNVSEKIRTER